MAHWHRFGALTEANGGFTIRCVIGDSFLISRRPLARRICGKKEDNERCIGKSGAAPRDCASTARRRWVARTKFLCRSNPASRCPQAVSVAVSPGWTGSFIAAESSRFPAPQAGSTIQPIVGLWRGRMDRAARSESSELVKNAPVRFNLYAETSSISRADASPLTARSARSAKSGAAGPEATRRRKSVTNGAYPFNGGRDLANLGGKPMPIHIGRHLIPVRRLKLCPDPSPCLIKDLIKCSDFLTKLMNPAS